MAPAIVLWVWWRRGARTPFARVCVAVIVATYVAQLALLAAFVAGIAAGIDPLDEVARLAGAVAVVVAAEYVGHVAAVALAVGTWRRTATRRVREKRLATEGSRPCR